MTAHPPIAAAITDARNKPRNMSPPAWVRTASMPRAPPRFESPLASLLSPSGLYCDAVPPDIPLDLAAALAERYELREVLGRGGMATVYLAYDRKHRRDVALKVLLPGLAAFLGVERFLKEIQVAARLTHPHILALHDSGEAGGFLYYVMQRENVGIDRKSTRLNSSHLGISYAVFCLKKKTSAALSGDATSAGE